MTFRHPALLARMAAGVDVLSAGRFILGIGAGWNVPEHEAFGVRFPPLKQRMDVLEDSAAIIRGLWTEGSFSFKGRAFELKDAHLNPKPAQRPAPLLIGGAGEKRTLRTVARYADEWNVTPMPLERYRDKVRILEAHCATARRDPRDIARSMMCGFIIGRDENDALKRVEALQIVMPAMAQTPPDQLLRGMASRGWLAGTPDQVVNQIKALEAEGVSRIMLQHHNQVDFDALDLIAKEVMPRVA
jgi:alkanesulfonate monooxygenase SsuD/methylene tetrahydromethanopterin reductase-like flavin-dependent oxidoreductase (luciferase family)